ncbi:hypothetical protein [Solicola sp. PLA-1-18]|uniref:hypothetical protein n=1 Tax=Solicola sp. PLA-1-18 TaxID=3380532 RepID=UPI003B7A4CBD
MGAAPVTRARWLGLGLLAAVVGVVCVAVLTHHEPDGPVSGDDPDQFERLALPEAPGTDEPQQPVRPPTSLVESRPVRVGTTEVTLLALRLGPASTFDGRRIRNVEVVTRIGPDGAEPAPLLGGDARFETPDGGYIEAPSTGCADVDDERCVAFEVPTGAGRLVIGRLDPFPVAVAIPAA